MDLSTWSGPKLVFGQCIVVFCEFGQSCDALAHEIFFLTHDVFCHIKTFWNGKKCDDSACTEKYISLPVSDFSHIPGA